MGLWNHGLSIKLTRVGSKSFLELFRQRPHSAHTIACKSCHDDRMVFARFGHPGHGHIAVSYRFDLIDSAPLLSDLIESLRRWKDMGVSERQDHFVATDMLLVIPVCRT